MRAFWCVLTALILFVAVSATKEDDSDDSGVIINEDESDSAGEEALKVYMESQKPCRGSPRESRSVDTNEEVEDSQENTNDTSDHPIVSALKKPEVPPMIEDVESREKSSELSDVPVETVVPQLESKPELEVVPEDALAPVNRTAATARKGFRGRGFGGRGWGGRGWGGRGWGFGFGRPFGFGAPFGGGFFPSPFMIG